MIPPFDHNLVLPPHLGNPANPNEISPYRCSTVELCMRFSTSPQRIDILKGLLVFRDRMRGLGLKRGFQWLDGSFLENIEVSENRPPNDLDIITMYWGYESAFLEYILENFPEFADTRSSKKTYKLDHYNVDIGINPEFTVDNARYWSQLFSHNRSGVWKGMLRLEINTPDDDEIANLYLNNVLDGQ